jgi:hypothetical protein
MQLYSTDAPVGWNQLTTSIKQKFYDIAGKGDWTAQEAYDHLVPNHLKDNPDEVVAWMDGSDVLDINDKDVSRITSGENGGEYSTENTIMEDMTDNRARGAENMSDVELDQVVSDNADHAQLIEDHFDGATEAIADVAENAGTLFTDAAEALTEGILPAVFAYKAANYVANQCDSTEDKLGYGALAAGGAALLASTPLGWTIAGVYGTYKLSRFGFKVINRFAN